MSVIFLNGCTSAGKTTIARALQQQMPGLWLTTGIDHAIHMAPATMHHHEDGFHFDTAEDGSVQLNFGPLGWGLLLAHQRAAAAIAHGGAGLILDEVLVVPGLLDAWLSSLAGHEVWMVGVHCDLDELERREIARGDRRSGQARGQYGKVHTGVRYDVELNATTTTPEELATRIISMMESRGQPTAFPVMQEMRAVSWG